MRKIRLYVVTSDPRTGDGGGRWLAATPNERDVDEIAKMVGGVASSESADAVDDDGRIRFLDSAGCPVYNRAWDCAETLILSRFAGGGAVFAVEPRYLSTWESADYTRRTTATVCWRTLEAIAKLAEHQHRERLIGVGNFTVEAVAESRRLMQQATEDELDCARYWLGECNRLNARVGREQVSFPNQGAV